MDYWANFFAQPAINTLLRIKFGIPKAFVIGLEVDGVLYAYIAAGVAAAAVLFVVGDSNQSVSPVCRKYSMRVFLAMRVVFDDINYSFTGNTFTLREKSFLSRTVSFEVG
jgi:hypothetical protein